MRIKVVGLLYLVRVGKRWELRIPMFNRGVFCGGRPFRAKRRKPCIKREAS